MSGIDGLLALSQQAHIVAGVHERHREAVWVGALYPNHIALAPHFELKIAINF
jgi:hypothetical protein